MALTKTRPTSKKSSQIGQAQKAPPGKKAKDQRDMALWAIGLIVYCAGFLLWGLLQ